MSTIGATIDERTASSVDRFLLLEERINFRLRVCVVGIVQSFDSVKQTVVVRPALTENVKIAGLNTTVNIPDLLDVPIQFPRAGGFSLTMPIAEGDECLVVFADSCFDAWWQSGGVQNEVEKRRHDLSDGIALFGIWSQTRRLGSFSTASAQLRDDAGATVIDVAKTAITITAQNVTVNASSTVQVNAQTANVQASGNATLQGQSVTVQGSNVTIGSQTKIDNREFLTHTHSGIQSGGSVSGPVV